MIKNISCLLIIYFFTVMQSCKKEEPAPIGHEPFSAKIGEQFFYAQNDKITTFAEPTNTFLMHYLFNEKDDLLIMERPVSGNDLIINQQYSIPNSVHLALTYIPVNTTDTFVAEEGAFIIIDNTLHIEGSVNATLVHKHNPNNKISLTQGYFKF